MGRMNYGNQQIQDGLILYLDAANPKSFDGNSTNWYDLSEFQNNGLIINGIAYTNSNNGTMSFNPGYCKINNNITSSTGLTINSWFKRTVDNNQDNCILHKGIDYSITNSQYWMGISQSYYLTATIGAEDGVGCYAGITNVLAELNTWYNLTASWNGSVVKVYINGVYNKQYNLPTCSNINFFTSIGSNIDGSHQFNGNISIISMYNKSLTDSQILQNYNSARNRFGL